MKLVWLYWLFFRKVWYNNSMDERENSLEIVLELLTEGISQLHDHAHEQLSERRYAQAQGAREAAHYLHQIVQNIRQTEMERGQ